MKKSPAPYIIVGTFNAISSVLSFIVMILFFVMEGQFQSALSYNKKGTEEKMDGYKVSSRSMKILLILFCILMTFLLGAAVVSILKQAMD